MPDAVLFRRQVAAVFDEDVFFPSLTVREHLLLVARGHSLSTPDDAVDAELSFFGLAERSHAVPDALSSGQRRRLLLAAAFIRPSSLMILDEPEQRLDPVMRDALAQHIQQLADAGTTVVQCLSRTIPVCSSGQQPHAWSLTRVVQTVDTERGPQIIAGA
jgi:ABC-type multidrug transport system ATPase subunit